MRTDAPVSVLVVEDDPVTAQSLANLLRLCGHPVRVATDGLSALDEVLRDPPDALLLDIGMPGMDGWELARRVRELPRDRRPLLVAVTGCATDEDVRRSEEAGIDLHLPKPADPNSILAILGRFGGLIGSVRHNPDTDASAITG